MATNTPTYLNYFKTGLGLTVFFSGHDPISVAKQNALYSDLEDKLRKGLTDGLYELASLAARVKSHSKGKFILVEQDGANVILLHGKPMPRALSEFTLQFVEQGFNTDFIERFWKNLCLNPSQESRDSLYEFIEANNMTLTDDGCFIGYRGVRDNWKDWHTNTMDNSVGQVLRMDRSKVESDPTRTCASGLHVAAWGYASGYGGRKIEVKVNPKDVVTVPPDYNQQKMRVCEFTVVNEVTAPRDTILHPDTFADPAEAWDTGSLVDDNDGGVATAVATETFILNVTSTGGVNIPKELAKKAGFTVGQVAHVCKDDNSDVVKIYPSGCCQGSDVCSTRKVDSHNSIRLGSGVFAGWRLAEGDDVTATIEADCLGTYIELA